MIRRVQEISPGPSRKGEVVADYVLPSLKRMGKS